MTLGLITLASCSGEEDKTSENSKEKSTSVSNIKEKCDCVNTVGDLADEIIAEAKDAEDKNKVRNEGVKKIQEVMEHCNTELEVSQNDLKACDNYDEVDAKMKQLNSL